MADTPWKKVKGVAAIADCGVKPVYAAIRSGKLRAAKINGRRDYRVHEDWIREWLEASAAPVAIVRRAS